MIVAHSERRTLFLSRVRDYFNLTKPTIVLLMLVTGLPAVLMAGNGMPSPALILVALLGTALAAASASAINHYLDRDIDAIMERTRERPIPGDRVDPSGALAFGLVLGVIAVLVLGVWANWLAAALALGSILFYVVVYTMWLKRSTPQNIVIGGAAGATAPLIGWAAVTNDIGLPAWLMFLIIFMWTPPHFWALALYRKEEYAKAGIPMMPVVAGEASTRFQILVYTLLTVPISLALFFIKANGLVYLAGAIPLNLLFAWYAWKLYQSAQEKDARRLFWFSILYMLLLFIALFLDATVMLVIPGLSA